MRLFVRWATAVLMAAPWWGSAAADMVEAESYGPSTGIAIPAFWWDQFRPPENRRQWESNIIPLADDGLLVAAYEGPLLGAPHEDERDFDNYRILLIRTDSAGHEIWRQRYPLSPDTSLPAPNVAVAADGSIFLCDGATHLYRLRHDGSIVWHVAEPRGKDAYHCVTMAIAPDGALYIAGTPGLPDVDRHPTLMRIDPADGSVVWQIDYDLYGVSTIWIATSIRFLSPDRLLWSFTGPPDNRDAHINGTGAHLVVSSDGRLQVGGLPRFNARPDHREQRDKWMSSDIACLADGDIIRFGFEFVQGNDRQLRIDRWSRPGFVPVSSRRNTDWYLGYGIYFEQSSMADIYFLGERDDELIFGLIVDTVHILGEVSFVILATDGIGRTRWVRRFPYDDGFVSSFFGGDAVLTAGRQAFLIDYDSDDPRPVGLHALIRRIQFDRAPVIGPCF